MQPFGEVATRVRLKMQGRDFFAPLLIIGCQWSSGEGGGQSMVTVVDLRRASSLEGPAISR